MAGDFTRFGFALVLQNVDLTSKISHPFGRDPRPMFIFPEYFGE